MFREIASMRINGKGVAVCKLNFDEKNGKVTGNVHGVEVTTTMDLPCTISDCIRACYAVYEKEFDYRITDTHVIRNKNGCIAKGIVNGKSVSVGYSGFVVSESGEYAEGKAWLERARRDLIIKYKELEKANHVSANMQVTPEFIKRCEKFLTVTENSLGEPVAIIGNHHVYFARKANVAAPLEYREKTAVMKEIDTAFAAVKAEEEVWFEKYE